MKIESIAPGTCIVRDTASHKGRTRVVAPGTIASRYLHCGRIVLDIVLVPQGYHPNVAAPGGSINCVWMMAANVEDDDRQYGVVNIHTDFATLSSGLDKGRSARP